MLVDISDIKKDLNEEEKEIFDKVIKAMNTKSITVNMQNLAFAAIMGCYFAQRNKACNPYCRAR